MGAARGTAHVAAAAPGAAWTAGAVARMLDVPPSTLRGWHRRYRIPTTGPSAEGGSHRRYSDADVAALTRMRHLIDSGVSTSAAAKLAFEPPVPDERRSSRVDGGDDVRAVIDAARRLDAHALVTMLDAHLTAYGVVQMWQRLCCPALDAVGGERAADLEGHVDVVQLLSWAITVALHRVAATPQPSPTEPVVLLGCVTGERHTLPLEALRAALAQAAVPAHLLGADLPNRSLQEALHRTAGPPSAVVLWTHTAGPAARRAARELIAQLTSATRLLLAGPGWDTERHPHALYPASLREAVDELVRA